MFRYSILAAAISSCVTTTTFGGFTVSTNRYPVDATLDRIDFWALNTGGDTGTGLLAVEFTSVAYAGQAVWRSTSAGNWNALNSADSVNRSQVRVDPEDVSTSSLVSKTPSANQPLAPAYGGSTVALGTFSVVIASLAGAIPPQSVSQGNLFATLFVSKNYYGSIGGYLGGSTGEKVAFGNGVQLFPPVIAPVPEVDVAFGQVVADGANFSVNVTATDANFGDTLSLTTSPVSGISNVLVTPSSSTSPATFTVSGRVDYALNGTSVVVPIRVTDGLFNSTSSFRLNVTPEPTLLGAMVALAVPRRRRA